MYEFAIRGHIYEEITFGAVVLVIETGNDIFGHWLFRNCLVLVQGDTTMSVGSIRELSIRERYWKRLT